MDFTQAIILAIVEGLTEYLPISSTGHLILTSWLLGNHQDPFVKDFTVMVQFGAILAVVFLYWRKFLINTKVYPQILLGFLPAAVIGLLVKNKIDALLGNVWVVGGGDLVGQFYDAGLLDELIVQIAPVTLGAGTPLLPRRIAQPALRLTSVTTLGGLFAELRYAVPRPESD